MNFKDTCFCCNNTAENGANIADDKICTHCNNIYKLVRKLKNKQKCNNLIYWYIDVDSKTITFYYDGVITKEEYSNMKTLDMNTEIYFEEIAKYTSLDCCLHEIIFSEDEGDILKCIKGNKRTNFDLMNYFYEEEILKEDI